MTNSKNITNHLVQPQIFAFGGGKGGVGKSALTAGIGITLAKNGKQCILADFDLGGANLHTFLGMSSTKYGISDLLNETGISMMDILSDSPFENLKLVSGSCATLNIANLKHFQKERLIRQIFSLEADYILIDLGAGSSFNVLDFFIAAHNGVMVITPTPTSIENAYHFLRAVYFRKLRQVIRTLQVEPSVCYAFDEKGVHSPREFIAELRRRNQSIGSQIHKAMTTFSPSLILNMTHSLQDIDLGNEIVLASKDFLGIKVKLIGAVRTDESVLNSLKAQKPVLTMLSKSLFAKDLQQVANKLDL